MSSKRWFLPAPTFAITNFEAIRAAAIAAKVTLVDESLKLDDETAAAGMPAVEIDPAYAANVYKSTALAPTYAEVSEVRNRIESHLAFQNQLRVEAGNAAIPLPTSAEIEKLARDLINDKIANSGNVNPARMVNPVDIQPASTEENAGTEENTGTQTPSDEDLGA